MVKYICPECGGDVRVVELLIKPPMVRYMCTCCDYLHVSRPGDKLKQIVVAPKRTDGEVG